MVHNSFFYCAPLIYKNTLLCQYKQVRTKAFSLYEWVNRISTLAIFNGRQILEFVWMNRIFFFSVLLTIRIWLLAQYYLWSRPVRLAISLLLLGEANLTHLTRQVGHLVLHAALAIFLTELDFLLQIDRSKDKGPKYTDLGGKRLYGKRGVHPNSSIFGSWSTNLTQWRQPRKFDVQKLGF